MVLHSFSQSKKNVVFTTINTSTQRKALPWVPFVWKCKFWDLWNPCITWVGQYACGTALSRDVKVKSWMWWHALFSAVLHLKICFLVSTSNVVCFKKIWPLYLAESDRIYYSWKGTEHGADFRRVYVRWIICRLTQQFQNGCNCANRCTWNDWLLASRCLMPSGNLPWFPPSRFN